MHLPFSWFPSFCRLDAYALTFPSVIGNCRAYGCHFANGRDVASGRRDEWLADLLEDGQFLESLAVRIKVGVVLHRDDIRQGFLRVADGAGDSDVGMADAIPEPVFALPFGAVLLQDRKRTGDLCAAALVLITDVGEPVSKVATTVSPFSAIVC